MIIDGHLHLDNELPLEGLIKIMDKAGIDKAVLFASFWEGIHYVPEYLSGVSRTLLSSSILHKVGMGIYNNFHSRNVTVDGQHQEIAVKFPSGKWAVIPMRPENEPVARARDKHPDRFIPFVFLNAINNPDLIKQFEKWVDHEGFKGVKIHTWSHPFDLLGDFLEVAKAAESRGIPLLIHMGGSPESSNVQGLRKECPDLTMILAHSGIPFFKRSRQMAKTDDKTFIDLAGPYLASVPYLNKLIKDVGAKNCIFGSDGAWGLFQKDETFSYDRCMTRFNSLDITEEDKNSIMAGTMAGILGI